jgi:hypothetical protein
MINIQVNHNIDEITRLLQTISSDIEKKAAVRALNRTITQAKTAAKREMVKQYSFKSSTVEATMRIFNAHPGRIEATLNSKGRRTRLINMAARQTKKGTSVKVSRQRKIIKSAFIAEMKNGSIGVFSRTSNKRLPIKQLYTIAIPEAMGAQIVSDSMRKTVREKFMDRFQHELNNLMRRGR